jgi:hypothetical protein
MASPTEKVTVRGQVYNDIKILKSIVLRLAKEFMQKTAQEGETPNIMMTNSNDLLNTVETATPAVLASMAEEYMNKLENAVVEAVKEELEDDDYPGEGNSLCEVEAKLDDGAADPVSTLSLPFAIHDQLRLSFAFGQVNIEKFANNRDVYLAQLSGDTSSLKGMPISADPNPLFQHWQKHWEEEREAEEQNAMNSEDPMYKQRKGPNKLQPFERAMLKKDVEKWWDQKRREKEEQYAMNSEDPMYKERKGPNRLQPSEQEMLKKNVEEWWDEKRAETKRRKIAPTTD